MSAEEKIRRYKLQLEALASWPDPDRALMERWVLGQIKKLQLN